MVSALGQRARKLALCWPLLVATGCVSQGNNSLGSHDPPPGTMTSSQSITSWFTKRPAPSAQVVTKRRPVDPNTLAKKELQNPAKVHLAYAKWQEQIGQLTEARESYEFVLQEEPKSTDAILGLSRLDQLSGRTTEAEAGIRRALEMQPNDPSVLDTAGQFYASSERWDKAVEFLNKAVVNAPGDKPIRFHLAVALARSGQIEAARTHFVQAGGEAQADYNLGLILYEQGHVDACRERMRMALAAQPNFSEAKIWLKDLSGEPPVQTAGSQQPQHAAVQLGTGLAPAANTPRQARMPQAPSPRAVHAQHTSLPRENAGITPASGEAISRTAVSQRPVTRVAAPDPRQSRPDLSSTPSRPPKADLPPSLTPEQREQWENQLTP